MEHSKLFCYKNLEDFYILYTNFLNNTPNCYIQELKQKCVKNYIEVYRSPGK